MRGHKLIFLALLLFGSLVSSAQTITTEGTDFWFSYLNNWLQSSNNQIITELYISSTDTTSGVIEIPLSTNFQPVEFQVVPGQATRMVLPSSLVMAQGSESIENKGVHITSESRVSVYAMNKRQYSADVTVLIPTPSLGREYRVMSHWEPGNRNGGDNSQSQFMVVSISDGTEIEITPSVSTRGGKSAGVPFTIILDQGQIYQVQADDDLTGSLVRSIGASGCNNFAVFGGNRYTKVGECDHPDGHDHLYSQLYPTNTWGKKFTMVPLRSRSGGDVIKVLAHQDDTEVVLAVNDTLRLDAGEFYQTLIERVTAISADKPISLGQFSRSQACDNTTSDPFLITISPDEQLLKKVTFNAPVIATLDEYYLNVVTPSSNVQTIKLDGVSISNNFQPVPNNDEMHYARISIIQGNHTLESAEGFIAYVYGYGYNESFGYSTGASLENLNVEILVQDADRILIPTDSLCKGAEIFFEAKADTIFTSFIWEFGDGSQLATDNPDPVSHTYESDGSYEVVLTVSTDGGDCASGTQEISKKNVTVLTPTAEVLGPRSVCPNTADVAYFAQSDWKNTYEWFISGGTLDSILPGDSIIIDWGGTNSNARVAAVPTSVLGCVGDTVFRNVDIGIELDPEAPFGPDTLCSSSIDQIVYETFKVNTSIYNWTVDFGEVSSGQGESNVEVNWDGYGWGKIWFEEVSSLDNVCSGVSDTLRVFIERNPSAELLIESPDTLDILQDFTIGIETDSIYRLMKYSLGDGTIMDTIPIVSEIQHSFTCFGAYNVNISVMDTTGFCMGATSNAKTIYVREPRIEMINVTHHDTDTSLLVNWKTQYLENYPQSLHIRRVQVDPAGDVDQTEMQNEIRYTDPSVSTSLNVYNYQVFVDPDPSCIIGSLDHNSIRAVISSDNNVDGTASWNEYINWSSGVDHYEVWERIDDGEWQLVGEQQELQFAVTNDNRGFDYCYRVKAIESAGNQSHSLSNTACLQFYPEITTYNVISPNGDGLNESFVIEQIELYPSSELVIMNRYGKEILSAIGYQNTFDGKINGKELPAGVYYWTLRLNEPRAPQQTIKGFVQIMR